MQAQTQTCILRVSNGCQLVSLTARPRVLASRRGYCLVLTLETIVQSCCGRRKKHSNSRISRGCGGSRVCEVSRFVIPGGARIPGTPADMATIAASESPRGGRILDIPNEITGSVLYSGTPASPLFCSLFAESPTHSLTHSLASSLAHSLLSLARSLARLFTRSLTHPPTHSLTRSLLYLSAHSTIR